MKNIARVLVVDDNQTITSKIEKQFSSHASIEVVKTINNGREALDYITNNSKDFDIILMDIILPEIDGLDLLRELKKNKINKKVIVLTSYKKEYAISLCTKFGVAYYMLKPFNPLTLETRILETAGGKFASEELTEYDKDVHVAISRLLHQLGIPSHIKGYSYIRDSVFIFYKHFENYSGITKEIYPEIANKYATTASRVERAIRHAIEVSWNRGDYDLMEEIFGNSVAFDRAKPTNAEFIATIADRIRFDKKLVQA